VELGAQRVWGGPADVIERPVWTAGDLLLITLGGFAFLLIALVITPGLAAMLPWEHGQSLLQLAQSTSVGIVAQTLGYLGLLALVFRTLRHRTHRNVPALVALRWNKPRTPWAFVVSGVGLALACVLISLLLPISQGLPIEQAMDSPVSAYVIAVFGIAVAPLVEEIYFRGLLYPLILRAFRRAGATMAMAFAITLTALPFALIHGSQLSFSWAPLLVVFCVGVILTWVRAHSRSLAASWMVHVSYNTTLLLFMFVQTAGFRHLK
jgi:uncharacterized protein